MWRICYGYNLRHANINPALGIREIVSPPCHPRRSHTAPSRNPLCGHGFGGVGRIDNLLAYTGRLEDLKKIASKVLRRDIGAIKLFEN